MLPLTEPKTDDIETICKLLSKLQTSIPSLSKEKPLSLKHSFRKIQSADVLSKTPTAVVNTHAQVPKRHCPYVMLSTHCTNGRISLRDPRLRRPKGDLSAHVQQILEEKEEIRKAILYDELNYAKHQLPKLLHQEQTLAWLRQQETLLQRLLEGVKILKWNDWIDVIEWVSEGVKQCIYVEEQRVGE